MNNKTYNGYKNKKTWNVMLWINNDEIIYNQFKELNKKVKFTALYESWILEYKKYNQKTPDGVCWADRSIDYDEVNEHINELFRNE